MNPSEPFIKRPIMTILVMLSILFFGLYSLQQLPVSDLPNVDFPTITVTTSYPGANPETVANNVTSILERTFSTLDGINLIVSTSYIGSSTIVLQFELSKSIESASIDVQAAINQAQALLPKDLPYLPTYSKINPASSPILFFAITSSSMPQWALYDYGNRVIGQRLNMIENVAKVYTYGTPYAIRVRFDPRKLAARNIGIDEVGTMIQSQNVNNPIGNLYGPSSEYTLTLDGQILESETYNSMILRNENGAITRISDVGYAMDGLLDDKSQYTYIEKDIHQPTIVLAIQKKAGANTLSIVNAVEEMLPSLLDEVPSSLQIKRIFDRGVFIKEAVHDVELTLIIAFILVVAVIFFYLGEWIATVIPTLALPMAIIGTFAFMHVFHFSLDVLSLLAITLSIGFLIDDAVVVMENIARHVEMGKTPMQAALDGSRQICFTVISMTLCLVAVFIPLIFMGGIIGKLFNEFAIIIVTSVVISGFISISLTPMLSSRFIQPKHPDHKPWPERISDAINNWFLSHYKPSLQWTLRHPKTILLTGAVGLAISIYILAVIPRDLLPPDDLGFIEVFSESTDGTSPFLMQNYQKKLGDILKANPHVASIVSINGVPQDNQGIMFVRLKPYKERPPVDKVIANMRAESSKVPGLRVFYKSMPLIDLQVGANIPQANYQLSLNSLNEQKLYSVSEELRYKMMASNKISQVNSDLHISQPQLQMNILRDRASLLNVTASSIENALNLAYANSQLSPFNTLGSQYYVVMETIPEFYKNPAAMRQLYVKSSDDKLVSLFSLVKATEGVGPMSVNHSNILPSVTLTFDINKNVPLSTALKEVENIAKETLPQGVESKLIGTAEVFKSSFADLNLLLLIMVFVIYVILGILYENFFHPLTVMSTLPPAALGGLLTLLIFNIPFSLYAFVGMVLLLGIVMKNGIIMIDFANDLIDRDNKDLYSAITESCYKRLRPILMTTIAAMMGAVPIALGVGGLTALSRRPLGIVIVGGLIFSQVLTLYFTPVVFIEVERFREKYFPKRVKQE